MDELTLIELFVGSKTRTVIAVHRIRRTPSSHLPAMFTGALQIGSFYTVYIYARRLQRTTNVVDQPELGIIEIRTTKQAV